MNALTVETMASDDLAAYADMLSRMLQKHAPFQQLRDLRDDSGSGSYDPGLWSELSCQGLMPEPENSGATLPMSVLAHTFRHMGRHLAVTPFLDTLLASWLCLRLGLSVERELFEKVSRGDSCLALIGFDGSAALSAQQRGDAGKQPS